MGVDFSHCYAHWSYGGFHRFRQRLAREIGIDLDQMAGFRTSFRQDCEERSWDGIDDPIVDLLNHSDCGGDLSPEQCARVAPRLRELVANWPDDPEEDASYDREHALFLAGGMEKAAKRGQKLSFR